MRGQVYPCLWHLGAFFTERNSRTWSLYAYSDYSYVCTGDTSSSALLKEYLIYLIDWLEEELKHFDESVEDLLDFLFELYPTGFYRTKVSALIDYCMNK